MSGSGGDDLDLGSLELGSHELRAQYADGLIPASTSSIEPLARVAGQDRALEAISFGLSVEAEGYNIAVAGQRSSGRKTAVAGLVHAAAQGRPPVRDWCYLHNFDDPYRPRAVALPSATGDDLKRDLARLVDTLGTDLPTVFDDESYDQRRTQALQGVMREREQILEGLQRVAGEQGFVVSLTPSGFVSLPRGDDGQPIPPEAFPQLPETTRRELEQRAGHVQEASNRVLRELRRLEGRARDALEALNREVARFVSGPVLDELREQHPQPELAAHFAAIEKDILDHIDTLRRPPAAEAPPAGPAGAPDARAGQDPREAIFRRYAVNLFVTHGEQPAPHAPIVDEAQPTYSNLFGRLDYEPRYGSMTTDFTMIRPGAVHLANGGYLILQAEDLLSDPRSWRKLKQSLRDGQVRVEEIGETAGPFPVVHLIPEPIPLDLKVVLIGSPATIGLLQAADPDFGDLFKIRAEFEPDTPIDEDAIRAYIAFVRRSCDDCALRQFDQGALVEILRYGNRLAGRQDRLSTRYGAIQDLCEEANQRAVMAGDRGIGAAHVRDALAAMRRRSDLVPDRIRRSIAEGSLHIETSGSVMGQVNGLAVFGIGEHMFGTPSRITCRTGAGTAGVINIEREVERSGAIHSKGILVLNGFLIGTFGREHPLSFSASLTFEQSYAEVDGDSASSAELYAILTSLARVPIRQDLAVTGSVDQFGNIQPVGGVTEKVEGFFDVCAEAGLTGQQGVIIPHANRRSLTLRDDVVRAVAAGQFHIWAVTRVEEGLRILTGREAGGVGAHGVYPPGSIFRGVTDALAAMRPAAPAAIPVRTPADA